MVRKIRFTLPKNKYARIFVKAILITIALIGSLLITLTIMIHLAYQKVHIEEPQVDLDQDEKVICTDLEEIPKEEDNICKNILVFGVDEGASRTDTILLVHVNSNTSQVAVISIPRDTRVTWTAKQLEYADKLGRLYQNESKLTDMSSLGGIENLRYFTIASIEQMLDIKVDNYVVVNTKMLREVVDKMDGVEFNVPRVMQYYDSAQGLEIDLMPGIQTLDGKQAEGVLRWRHNKNGSEQYATGDLGRIETQQAFIKAFSRKILDIRSATKLSEIVRVAYKNIKTDMSITETLSYLPCLNKVSTENIIFKTLPGEPVMQDRSYFIIDEEEAKAYISLIFEK